jgi:hypothetical protein
MQESKGDFRPFGFLVEMPPSCKEHGERRVERSLARPSRDVLEQQGIFIYTLAVDLRDLMHGRIHGKMVRLTLQIGCVFPGLILNTP